MSRVSLGTISLNWSALNNDFYVAPLIDSKSGLEVPRIINSKLELESMYGSFSYLDQYKDLLDRKIPVLPITVTTKESKYNKCSLRLNRKITNTNIEYCHPKLDKQYEKFSMNNAIISDATKLIETRMKFYPLVYVILNNQNVDANIKYITTDIGTNIIVNDYQLNALAVFEELPDIDESSEYLVIKEYSNGEIPKPNSGTYTFTIQNVEGITKLPEVVVTDINGNYIRPQAIYYNDLSKTEIVIKVSAYDLNNQLIPYDYLRFDIRFIPNNYMSTGDTGGVVLNYRLFHSAPRYRVIRFESNGIELRGNCTYISDSLTIVNVYYPSTFTYKFNLIQGNSYSTEKVLSEIKYYNTILDFSEVSVETFNQVAEEGSGDVDGTNFILLDTPNGITCYSTCDSIYNISDKLTSSDYRVYDKYDLNQIEGYEDDNKLTVLNSFYNNYNGVYVGNCKILIEILVDYINNWIEQENSYEIESYNGTPSLSIEDTLVSGTKFDRLINDSYIEDFWLCSNYKATIYLESLISNLIGIEQFNELWDAYAMTGDESQLPNSIEIDDVFISSINYSIPYDKMFISYSEPFMDPDYYDFKGLKIENSFNQSNDRLCQFTENDKLVEFYAIPYGEAGKAINITISKSEIFSDVYDITISNQLISESYSVYIIKPIEQYNADLIDIYDLNQRSQLVRVKLYTYELNNHLINVGELDVGQYEPKYDLTNVDYYIEGHAIEEAKVLRSQYLELPTGSWNLNRITEEEWIFNDLVDSITKFSKLEYYPDLILVDKVFDLISKENFIEFKKLMLRLCDPEYTDTAYEKVISLYTQCLINLHRNDIRTDIPNDNYYTSEDNRLAYFYGDLDLNTITYSVLFPYTINIINDNWLDVIGDNIIYDPFALWNGNIMLLSNENNITDFNASDAETTEITDQYSQYIYLDNVKYEINKSSRPYKLTKGNEVKYLYSLVDWLIQNKINFIEYDNLRYYYSTIVEPKDQSYVFIIRFLTSKISREVLKRKHQLLGVKESIMSSVLSSLLSNFSRFSDLYDSIEYSYELDNYNLKITITSNIKYLFNKKFKIDYNLNIE